MSKTKKLNKITKKLSPKKPPVRKKAAVKRSRKPDRRKELTAAGCVLLVLLVMGVVLLLRNPGDKTETGAVVPPGARAFCIDISHHNGEKIIWDSLKVMTDRDGRTVRSIGNATQIRPVGAVYMKASEGESMRDRRFRCWRLRYPRRTLCVCRQPSPGRFRVTLRRTCRELPLERPP